MVLEITIAMPMVRLNVAAMNALTEFCVIVNLKESILSM
ncbi:hypothetical protein Lp90_0070 [Lactiplantibacillus plantarum]|nr:hypothetical protein Lp90_0070 [Lactiplantibacillus plantarum]